MSRDPLKNLRVAAPCEVSWDGMAGDERVRHCALCSLNVYNFAEMTGDEVRALLARTEGRVCGRLYRRADGTMLTRDCPSGLRALRQRMSRLATAFIAALFSVTAFASDMRISKGSKVKFEIEQAATAQQAVFKGAVYYEGDSPLPGVAVVLLDEVTKREIRTVTDKNGVFTIAALNEGLYRVEVTLEGFTPTVVEHLLLKQNEITRARIDLRMDTTFEMGIIMVADPAPPMDNSISTTFSQDLINKLPL